MNSAYRTPSDRRRDHRRLVAVLPKEEIEAVDRWGIAADMPSRTEAVRQLLRQGLASMERNN